MGVRMTLDPFTPEEAEFLAEFTKIDIIPAGSLTELDLITETVPMMYPARRVSVPLWLAINLRKSTNCQIVPPPWFTVGTKIEFASHELIFAEQLTDLYQREINNGDSYQSVDFHYVEIATILLENIPNLPDGEKIRRLLQCIREARFKKTSEGLRAIDGNPLKVNLLSFMEINEIRPFLLNSLDKAAKLNVLESEERQARGPGAGKDAGIYDGTVRGMDSQMPYSMADYNPYSDTNNPYAFSTPQ